MMALTDSTDSSSQVTTNPMPLPRLNFLREREQRSAVLGRLENALEPSQPWPEGLSGQYLESHGLEGCLQRIIGCNPSFLDDETDNTRLGWLEIIRHGVFNRKSDGSSQCSINGRHIKIDQHMDKKIDDGRRFIENMETTALKIKLSEEFITKELQDAQIRMSSPPPPDGNLTKAGIQSLSKLQSVVTESLANLQAIAQDMPSCELAPIEALRDGSPASRSETL